MKCLSKERISAYIDGELPPEENALVEEHLGHCAACRAFFEELSALGAALKSHWQRKESSRLRRKPGCPDRESLAAFAAGTLWNAKECVRIASHLDECRYCAVQAAEEIEAATLLEEAASEVSEPVPAYLAASVMKMFPSSKPVWIGEIAAKWSELLKKFQDWLEGGLDFGIARDDALLIEPHITNASILASFKCPRELDMLPFSDAEKPAKVKPLPKKRQKPVRKTPPRLKVLERDFDWSGLKVRFSLSATKDSGFECRVTVLEAGKLPLPGVVIEMTERGKAAARATTDKKGSARFSIPGKGRYSFLIRHTREAVVDLDLA